VASRDLIEIFTYLRYMLVNLLALPKWTAIRKVGIFVFQRHQNEPPA